jgi:hypothetical protein
LEIKRHAAVAAAADKKRRTHVDADSILGKSLSRWALLGKISVGGKMGSELTGHIWEMEYSVLWRKCPTDFPHLQIQMYSRSSYL